MKQLTTIILAFLTINSFGQDQDSIKSAEHIFITEPTPSYPGGYDEMKKFIKKNLKYPKGSRTVQGKVYVEFMVNEDGSLSNFRIVKGLTDVFDHSALDLVKRMPNWIPATDHGRPIRTKMVMPITFD